MKKRTISIAYAVLVLLLMLSMTASAETDNAGNVFISDAAPADQIVERDLYWAGSSRSINGYQIGKSLIAAGRDINVNESTVGGSLRAAGYSITLNGVDVADNITAAGYTLQMSGVTAAGVYLAGNTLYFSGTADCVYLAGNTVTLDGEIHGNADIYAENVILGENLKVDGVLTIKSESEPELPADAKVETDDFKETETADNIEDTAEMVTGKPTEKPTYKPTEKPAEKQKETGSSSGFGGFIRGLLGTLLLAALICLLLGGEELSKPGEMVLSRPFPVLGSGFAGLFVIPGVILILLFTGIGVPSAGLLALLFAFVCIYSLTYAGMTLAKTLMPLFTYNKTLNNEWVCSLIGALVFWLLRKIPFIGMILQAAAIIYTLGYFIQTIYLRLRGNKPERKKGSLSDISQKDVLQPVGNTMPEISDSPAEDEAAADNVSEEMPDAAGAEGEADTDPEPTAEEPAEYEPDDESSFE